MKGVIVTTIAWYDVKEELPPRENEDYLIAIREPDGRLGIRPGFWNGTWWYIKRGAWLTEGIVYWAHYPELPNVDEWLLAHTD